MAHGLGSVLSKKLPLTVDGDAVSHCGWEQEGICKYDPFSQTQVTLTREDTQLVLIF